LKGIISDLTSNPDSVSVTKSVDEMGTLLSIDLDPSDMGKIIGKQGETINAIRKIVHAYGMKLGIRLSVKVNTPKA